MIDHPASAIRERCSLCMNCTFLTAMVRSQLSFLAERWRRWGIFLCTAVSSCCRNSCRPDVHLKFFLFCMQIIKETACEDGADCALRSRPVKIPSDSQMCLTCSIWNYGAVQRRDTLQIGSYKLSLVLIVNAMQRGEVMHH